MISMWEVALGFGLSLSDGNKVLQLENCESKCLAGFTQIFQVASNLQSLFLNYTLGSVIHAYIQQKAVKHPSCCRCSIGYVQR